MSAIVLKLECLTNLHVGNGESNYNIIDNEVERDPVTNYPIINSSGVKGALRVFIKEKYKDEYKDKCNKWFGAEGNEGQGGCLKILSANMLAMPARATKGEKAFYLITTEEMKREYENLKKNLGFADQNLEKSDQEATDIAVEEIDLKNKNKIKFDDKDIYVVANTEFKKIPLPVVARNKLGEGGKSENLWYEEVVPHESIFYVPVVGADDKQAKELMEEFKNAVNGKVIQFGGNASIGCGLCKVTVGGEKNE